MRTYRDPVSNDDPVRRSDPRLRSEGDVVINPAAKSDLDLRMNYNSQPVVFESDIRANLCFHRQEGLMEQII